MIKCEECGHSQDDHDIEQPYPCNRRCLCLSFEYQVIKKDREVTVKARLREISKVKTDAAYNNRRTFISMEVSPEDEAGLVLGRTYFLTNELPAASAKSLLAEIERRMR